MAKLTLAEKLQKKKLLEEKREARRLAKEKREREKAAAAAAATATDTCKNNATKSLGTPNTNAVTQQPNGKCYLFELSDETLGNVLWYTSAKELGALTLTCRHFSKLLRDSLRPGIVLSRLHRPNEKITGAVGCVDMCADRSEASTLIEQSYGGGDTNRIRAKGKAGKEFASDFVSYSRFLEEAVCGYATQFYGGKQPTMLPPFVNGRFVSVSPEHSLSRIGGGEKSGAGGSGVACWGVGKRGQLGQGKRVDEKLPKMLLGGIGYGIRIVQVSAGGGLVRVAHSLLLTSTGRVLSFGTGQYGALGHGFSGGKQLPDILRPKYIDALSGVRCVCVSAGELHSAAVSADGDVYTWGDGFCGQLGHADKRPQVSPVQVTTGGLDDERVSHISCGARHTLAITEDGEAFSWGLGHYGVLGRSFTPYDHDPETALMQMVVDEEDANPAVAQEAAGAGAPAPAPEAPTTSSLPGDAPNNEGDDTQQQQNNSHGANSHGDEQEETGAGVTGRPWNFDTLMEHLDMVANLSLTDSSDQCIPKLVDSMEGVKIVGASAGHRHSMFLDDRGWLYSCGAGISGCLGHGDNSNHMFPMKIKSFGTYLQNTCDTSIY